ncbi:DNA polymerase [Nitratireductor soli]|uniref:DNA polymerase n=1 Tax=Nitratireductor soli TaxID=1670619 RepID=UPI00065E7BC3|nr:DNA polymerase [Nitratireductor soli]
MYSDLTFDFETRSDIDLKKRGVYNYMASPNTQPLMASYKLNGGPVRRWRPGQPCPPEIVAHIEAGGMVSAHNAAFERLLWQMVLTPRYGWPVARVEQFRCTAATAAAMALPRSLDRLGDALGLTVRKDKEGTRLIRKFSIPRRPRKGEDPAGLYWNEPEDHPEDFERFHDYCDVDVMTEAEADTRMVPLSADEQSVYVVSEIINDRGIRIDRRSARAALVLAAKAKAILDRDMRLATGGYVKKCTEPGKLVEWVNSQGVAMGSAAKAEVDALLELDDLPANVRRAIELRQEAAKTSVSKLQAMLDRASADGRVRGTDIYHAASTGRWQSVGINKNNMPRPRKEFEGVALEPLFDAFRAEDPELLPLLYGPNLGRPLHLISDAIRGFILAAPDHDLVQADYSGIEGAVIAWSSGEDWKVKALHEIAADPSKPDLYRRTAASIMNTTTDEITKKHPLRQSVGKVSELALGFGGGVSAFYSMSQGYGVKLDPLFEPVWKTATEERREKAVKRYESCLKRGDSKADVLSREAWLACELIKVGWRASNPAIASGWKLREQAMREAIQNPGTVTRTLKFEYIVAHGYLWARLPSGRCLAYGAPRLTDQVWAKRNVDGEWLDSEVMDRLIAEKLALKGEVKIEGATSPRISALGVDSVTKKWRRFGLYGGLIAENDTQAVARDFLVNGMRKAEAASYPLIGHVYDELIAEVPRGWGDLAFFEKLICELPPWGEGMPLTAGGFRGKRYRKD